MTLAIRSLLLPLALSAGLSAFPGFAQTVPDGGMLPPTNLNLPSTITTFGKTGPVLRTATAIVNGEIITGTDIDQRLSLIVLANGGKIEAEEKERLRAQVLRNLVDEALQIQEAKANKIEVTKEEIDQAFNRVATNFRKTPAQWSEYLHDNGSSARSIRRQIQAESAWSRLLRRKVEVNISDAEVNAILERLNAAKGTAEYRVGEIFLSASPENAAEIAQNAQRIIEKLREGAAFTVYARQFSEASTATVGGDLGFVRAAQLPEALATAVQSMEVGQLVGPISVPGGFSILYLTDKRQVLMADPRDSVMSLRQLAIAIPPGMTQDAAKEKAKEFGEATRAMGGCGKVDAVAAKFGAEVVDNDQVKVRDLPPPLQELLLGLQIGQATPPFGSQAEGIRVLVMCGRDDPQQTGAPSFDQIMAQLEEDRTNRRAQRYLRDLRRDAVVDYR